MKRLFLYISMVFLSYSNLFAFQIAVKEIAATSGADKMPFLGIDGMTVRESSIYLVDRVMRRVAVLNNRDLSFRMDYNRFDNSDASSLVPGFIAVNSKYIFVADYGRSAIRVYSPRFDYIKKIVIKGGIFGIATDNNDNLWVAAVTMEPKQSIKKIDLDGNILQELFLTNAVGRHMELYYTFCIDKDNYFYVAYFTKNCVEVLHPSQGFVRQFMVPGLPTIVPWKSIKRGWFAKDFPAPDGIIFGSITTDNKGRVYLLTGDYSETPFREVDICTNEGKFLSWCVLKNNSHIIRMDKNEHLVSLEGNKNKVKIYELKNIPNR